ncbi:MAG: AcvB/VirJ family lysyl-phosphatidylglycerol hydrolase [Gemmatimonadaceae bacterium]
MDAVHRSAVLMAACLMGVMAPLHASLSQARVVAPARASQPLPVTLVPSHIKGSDLALLITGDGGYVAADRRLAEALTKSGVRVVARDARAYLSRKHSPDEAAADAARLLRRSLAAWKRQRVLLIGYSRGADIMPFIANRLPSALRERVDLIAMLSPASRASFKFHWRVLLFDTVRPTDLPVLPELERLRGEQIRCVYGEKEKEQFCPSLDSGLVHVVEREGSNRIAADDAPELARLILTGRRP